MKQTDLEYYNDESSHGNYQYVSLREIIDAMEMEALNNDSFIKHVARHNLIRHAKTAIREMNANAAGDILAFEITVPTSLVVTLPPDYVNYVRVSYVKQDEMNGGYHLVPLDINYNINTAIGYLQDHDANLLYDEDGYVLTSDASNAYSKPYKKYPFTTLCSPNRQSSDITKFSKNGEFTIDQRRGKILFGSEFSDRDVVVEYISDGLMCDDSRIKVHKFLKQAVEDWIYYASIERNRNVPMNEKIRSINRYKASMHEAKKKMMDFKINRLYRI